jgi:hypothetical protein
MERKRINRGCKYLEYISKNKVMTKTKPMEHLIFVACLWDLKIEFINKNSEKY